ncbi:MAG: transglycosylase SLT domain-containing protein [Candidatus Adiutrix sp.]|nr:transglycosylase SLT domain-containing protein [Candidatus Adiutrix sp.]
MKPIIHIVLSVFILFPALTAAQAGAASSGGPLRGLDFCGESVPLNQAEVFKAVDQNLVLLIEARSRIWLTLRRSPRFLPLVERVLAQAEVPADLKYLPLAVTHLSPVYNNIGRGIWRLRETEARDLGLRVDSNVDERLEPTAATAAAAKRLAALKKIYGSWTSALAAHLLGEQAFQRAVDEAGGETNFYKLYFQDGQDQLPMTVLAGKILFKDPAAFGYVQEPARAWPAWPGKRAVTPAPTTIKALADQYGRDYKSFRDMNPHLLGSSVPAGVTINY